MLDWYKNEVILRGSSINNLIHSIQSVLSIRKTKNVGGSFQIYLKYIRELDICITDLWIHISRLNDRQHLNHFSQSLLHKFRNVRTVSKSSDSEFFQNLAFSNWWSNDWEKCCQSCSEIKSENLDSWVGLYIFSVLNSLDWAWTTFGNFDWVEKIIKMCERK